MATITSILNRISELTSRNGKNSIGKNDLFGLLNDMVKRQQSTELNMSNLSLRKIYASIAAMNADAVAPLGDDGEKILKGQLVVISAVGVDMGKVYRYSGTAWEYVVMIGDLSHNSELLEKTSNAVGLTDYQDVIITNNDGAFISHDGSLIANSNAAYSNPIAVQKGDVVIFLCSIFPGGAAISSTDNIASYYKPVVLGKDPTYSLLYNHYFLVQHDGYIALSWWKSGTQKLKIAHSDILAIAEKTITGGNIADKTITGGNIADKTITGANIADNAEIGTNHIQQYISKTLTISDATNEVLTKLFIDVSDYTGEIADLTDVKIKVHRGGPGQAYWGVVLANGNICIGVQWNNTETNVQEFIENGIYVYAEFDWSKMAPYTELPYVNVTQNVFINDPRNINNLQTIYDVHKKYSSFNIFDDLYNSDAPKLGIPNFASGSINRKFNAGKYTFDCNISGNEASWQGYIGAILTKDQLISAGANFLQNVFLNLEFEFDQRYNNAGGWFIALRYGNALNYTMNTDPDNGDAIINMGGVQGVATGDNATWAGVLRKQTPNKFKINNIIIPPIYEGRNFVGVLFCMQPRYVDGQKYLSYPKSYLGENVGSETCCQFSKKDILVLTVNSHEKRIETIEAAVNAEVLQPLDLYYAACGDSITNGNHPEIEDISEVDPYCPIDGHIEVVYKRKSYAYYIALKNRLKWCNYGWGGTTLIDCTAGGISKNGFSTGRYTQFKPGVIFDYISLFFGWNDSYYGPIQQREIWLQQTYGSSIYYPDDISNLGTLGYATQSQYDACNAVTGVVGGINYDNAVDYFRAKFIGTIDSMDIKTWFGAWNVVLPYLMLKYPISKILLIVPYSRTEIDGPSTAQKDAVIAIANKWGLPYYDFRDSCKFMDANNTIIDEMWIQTFRFQHLTYDTLHPNQNGYKYIYPSINAKLMSI